MGDALGHSGAASYSAAPILPRLSHTVRARGSLITTKVTLEGRSPGRPQCG